MLLVSALMLGESVPMLLESVEMLGECKSMLLESATMLGELHKTKPTIVNNLFEISRVRCVKCENKHLYLQGEIINM